MVFLSSIFFYSCKKTDLPSPLGHRGSEQIKIANKFFKVPAGTDPAVQQIINEVIKRNNKKEFVSGFAAKNGYPVWDKVLAVKSGTKNANNIVGNTPSDTIIYIPLVLPNQDVTNGFITAVVNDSISLNYCLSQDYKNYPFSNAASNEGATRFASFLMMLDHEVFGHTEFEISDKRLFNYQSSHPNSPGVKMKLNYLDSTNSTGNNLLSGTTSICWLSQSAASAAGTCSCGPGGCWCWTDPRRAGCCSVPFCIEITVGMNEIPGWPTGGGGGGSTGGTTGGGGEIPHQYPCIPGPVTGSLLPEGPLPPCPAPGGGIGWVPIEDIGVYNDDEIDNGYGNPISGPYMCPNLFNNLQPQGIGSDVNKIEIWGIIADYNNGQYHAEFGMDIYLPTKVENWSWVDRALSYLYFPELWDNNEIVERIDASGITYWTISKHAQKMMASRAVDNASLESHESSLQLPAGSSLYKNEFKSKFKKWIKCFMGSGSCNIIHTPYSGMFNVNYTTNRNLCD